MIQLPKGISHTIFHNEHSCSYMGVEEYLQFVEADISDEDRAECIRTGEVWELVWYPDTPVGHHRVIGLTLEKVLVAANRAGG